MIDYRGQVALVTGAASGIGRGLAEALAARGARVVCADIDYAGAEDTAHRCGGGAVPTQTDLARTDAAGRLIAAVFAGIGRLDLIASNAGMPGTGRRLLKSDLDDRHVAAMFEVNMLAAVRFAQAYVPALETAGARGRLLITGSENSLSVPAAVKGFGLGVYAASKHGVLILAEWLRDEMLGGNKPLDVHILLPGGVYTGMTADGLGADPAKWPPQMGIITPERCAEIALAGLDAGLFYVPTHAHLADDMDARHAAIKAAVRTLALLPGG